MSIKKTPPQTPLGQAYPALDQLPCPHLRTGVMSGKLQVNEKGETTVDNLNEFIKESGALFVPRQGLVQAGKLALEDVKHPDGSRIGSLVRGLAADTIDLSQLRHSSLEHTGSVFHVDGRPNQDRVNWVFEQYNIDGVVRLSTFAKGQLDAVDADPGKKGHFIGKFELSALLMVHGRTDDKGELYLTKKDLNDIVMKNQFREGWTKPSVGGIALTKTVLRFGRLQIPSPDAVSQGSLEKATSNGESVMVNPFKTG